MTENQQRLVFRVYVACGIEQVVVTAGLAYLLTMGHSYWWILVWFLWMSGTSPGSILKMMGFGEDEE